MLNDSILKTSYKDLGQDFDELLFLFNNQKNQLDIFKKVIQKQKKHIISTSLHAINKLVQEFKKKNSESISNINLHSKNLLKIPLTEKSLFFYIQEKQKIKDLYRIYVGLISTLVTSTDWQSPSYNYSLFSAAGRQTGKIYGTVNDYKRDQHLDEQMYEKKFMPKGYLTYLTNSGMAAFTTIIYFLMMNKKIKKGIMIGSSSYFEIKEVIKKLNEKVTEFDETDVDSFIKQVILKKPGVIMLDSLSNTRNVIMPDFKKMIIKLSEVISEETYIVLDNSCLGPAFNLFDIGMQNKYMKLIVFESLNKYYQFGLDRVTAGIIYTKGKEQEDLFYAREHSGTNINDSSVYVLPEPNKKMLMKRLSRFERNATYVSKKLEAFVKGNHTKIECINYPGLRSQDKSFHGSFLTFSFKNEYEIVSIYKNFIRNILYEAKKMNINLIAGTSFGLDTSRIYLTALNSQYGEPFVRFSVGTESMWEVEKISMILKNVIMKL